MIYISLEVPILMGMKTLASIPS